MKHSNVGGPISDDDAFIEDDKRHKEEPNGNVATRHEHNRSYQIEESVNSGNMVCNMYVVSSIALGNQE